MEIMYPIVVIVCVIFGIIIFFVNLNKKKQYINGKKVANTKYIKETGYYKNKVKRYKIISNIIKIISLICIVISSILIARPITIQTKSEDKYNRDILISLDISTSECEVNLELVKKFKEILPDIKGDRIGIIIYNTAPIVYCPLTDDYDYVKECLEKIEQQLKLVVDNNGYIIASTEQDEINAFTFWYGGTVANNETRGSSLVGDGLARYCILIPRC